MYRHSPTRTQRSKGFKLKHILQVFVLVAVCLWLIYQVKHSHDKRKQFDENIAKDSLNMERNNLIVKFGRKDLISQEKGANKDGESHDGEAEEDDNEEGNIEQDKREKESKEEAKLEEETEEVDKHEDESEENDKHEEATEKEDEVEEATEKEDEHEEEAGEEDKHEEGTGEGKHEEQNREEDIQAEEKDDEGRGDGDDEVNEHEQEKADSDVDGEEEFIHEEKEKEDPIEKVTEETDDEDKDTPTKNDPSIEDHVHDEGSRNTREAREEQYKGDDASSAVTHDAQSTSTENDNGSTINQLNILEQENKGNSTEDGQNTTSLNLQEVEIAGNGTSRSDEGKNLEVFDSVSQINSSVASITGFESNDQQGSINITDNNGSSVNNETDIIISDPSHGHNATEEDRIATGGPNIQTTPLTEATQSTVTLHDTELNLNSSNSNATKTVEQISEESTDSSTRSGFDNTKNVEESNVSAERKDGSDSSVLEETTNDLKNEDQDNIKGTDEVQYDSIDTSDPSLEDKENHIDLDTLPEIRTEEATAKR